MKDPLLLEYSVEELAIERLMYLIEEDPREAFPKIKGDEYVQVRTGDTWFDNLDELVAQGKVFNLSDLVAAEDIKKLQPYLTEKKPEEKKKDGPLPEDFNDDYMKR